MAFLLTSSSRCLRSLFRRRYSNLRNSNLPMLFSEEVLQAKSEGKPVVALESTIITHGMPYPQNLETAQEVENIIRGMGATPATIAILKGQLTVGLTQQQLQYLAQTKGVVKASRRDLAPVMAGNQDGATTVAGTIIASELADIDVFVTGGIGGVHREGEQTMDVSADLTELGRSRTLVVCSGVKSILDIGRTLEYLETHGVTVCAFGPTDDFPAFYTPRSGYRAPHRAADTPHAARILHAARQLRLQSGIVVAVPVPQEHAMDENVIEDAIQCALKDAKKKGIKGKEVTPYILAAVSKATGGASLSTNIALIKNNAKVGADIAVEFQKLKNVNYARNSFNTGSSGNLGTRQFHTACNLRLGKLDRGEEIGTFIKKENLANPVLVIGGANVDRTYRVTEDRVQLDGSTHPCVTEQCGGGVGRNIAEALWRLRGGNARLLTAIGDDSDGRYLSDIAPGLLLEGCVVKDARTSMYSVLFDSKGECLLGLGDMDIHNQITPQMVDKHIKTLEKAPLVVLDGNVPQPTMDYVLQLCHEMDKPVFFEPTDRRKATKALHSKKYRITYSSPNIMELRTMAKFLEPSIIIEEASDINEIIDLSKIVTQFIKILIVTMGKKGVITVNNASEQPSTEKKPNVQYYSVEKLNNVENVSGAGDCFASGYIHGILSCYQESHCVSLGFEAAKSALLSKSTVPNSFQIPANFYECFQQTKGEVDH
ncbi:PREDICTED: pseudouridine-metabolizing bifunctional protein C1861.05 [Papilio polytes]|uniref:pseudouridine-metabolizing bifunctional protein C1861.05 n=1 Tax=Papilio polytes TaxID=76194 RepID=UPI0006763C63|nr:PREDICTED: pseudouridine-metabolizing bifunctional protein C1861.05 [Papilio polytes]